MELATTIHHRRRVITATTAYLAASSPGQCATSVVKARRLRCQFLRVEIIRAVVGTRGRQLGHLVGRCRVRHVTRLDGTLGRRVLCESGRCDKRKSQETN
jgi:hypothetical protein